MAENKNAYQILLVGIAAGAGAYGGSVVQTILVPAWPAGIGAAIGAFLAALLARGVGNLIFKKK